MLRNILVLVVWFVSCCNDVLNLIRRQIFAVSLFESVVAAQFLIRLLLELHLSPTFKVVRRLGLLGAPARLSVFRTRLNLRFQIALTFGSLNYVGS